MPTDISLWHEGCSECKYIVKRYRRKGDRYIAECLCEIYERAEWIVFHCIKDVDKKLREDPENKSHPAVVFFPWRQKILRYLTWLKDQLALQGSIVDAMDILGCAGHNHPLPLIPIERSKIPYISKLILELMADHSMFELETHPSRYRKHDEFVLEQTGNVLKKMETVARAIGQEAAADKIAGLFYDINGPSEQVIGARFYENKITVNDHQSMAILSQEEWKILTPLAGYLAHKPYESADTDESSDEESNTSGDERKRRGD